MMNRIILIMSFAGLLLLNSSCTKSESEQTGPATETQNVTFQAQLPESVASRSFGDGLTATKLTYAVYETGEQQPLMTNQSAGAPEITFEDRTATVSLRLTTGKSYDLLFWADAYGSTETSPYQIDFEAQTLTIDYSKALSNDEQRDAFYAVVKNLTVEVDRPVNQPVALLRPFAQLNVGTEESDLAVAVADGLQKENLQTQIEVNQVDQCLHFMDGTTSDPTTVLFGTQAVPSESLVIDNKAYIYLSMNYLLVGATPKTIDCSFSFTDGAISGSRTFSSVAVQRNYRTNIVGNILTQGTGSVMTLQTTDLDTRIGQQPILE